MTKQKGFLKDVTDNTVQSILHPKKYIRERKEARGKLPTKPYVPTSGPDKWIADAQNYLRNKLQPEKKVTAPRLKPKTQVTTSTKPTTTVNNQKTTTVKNKSSRVDMYGNPISEKALNDYDTYNAPLMKELEIVAPSLDQKDTVKPKSEAKSKQTYLKPKGEVNMKVKLFQRMLQDEGFKIKDDGMWGPKTQEAFEKLQANKANYAIAMEKFNQMEEALQIKRIEPKIQPVQVDSSPMSRLPEARQGFPTLKSAYYKQGGKMEFKYLKKGGKVNGKTIPNNNDENVIPTKEEGGVDMNPNFKKIKPKQTTKPAPIYKPKPKVETKEKGGKMGKKCSCGCAMKISKNAKGGLIEACACGCKTKK